MKSKKYTNNFYLKKLYQLKLRELTPIVGATIKTLAIIEPKQGWSLIYSLHSKGITFQP